MNNVNKELIISNISEYMIYVSNEIFGNCFLENYNRLIKRELNFIIKLGVNPDSKKYFIYKERALNLPSGLQKIIKYRGKKYHTSDLVNEVLDKLIKIETERLENNQ